MTEPMLDLVSDRLAAIEPQLQELNRWLYDNPEVAWEEFESSRRLAGFLADAGFEVEYPAYGVETAFAARLGSAPGPHIVLCAEYDALPSIGHACGHNLIASISVGAGCALAALVERLGIRLTVLGTPAEECAGGKVKLLEAGAFDGVDAAMMVHPTPLDILDPIMHSVSLLEVEFRGRASHAAFAPQAGVNALDAYVHAYNSVAMLRQQLPSTAYVHTIVNHGGDAINVIPETTRSTWCVRETTAESLAALRGRVEACLAAAAQATGCTVEISRGAYDYHDLVTDPGLAAAFERAASRLGRKLRRSNPDDPAGSTDLGNVSQVVPTIHPFFALGDGIANHDPRFADLTISDEGRRLLREGALALAWTVVHIAEGD